MSHERILSAESLLHLPTSIPLVDQLGGDAIWKYFAMCLETPRPSSKLDQIRAKVTGVADRLGLVHKTDRAGNVLICKPATPGYEHVAAVALQCHLDMVTSKNEGVEHDFDVDPIRVRIDGDWLKAESTTLGADDGIGVAACLALLEDIAPERMELEGRSHKDKREFVHPALELLFTADEETTMSGAMDIDPELLKARLMINVDSEEQNSICIGCAGGFEKILLLPVEWAENGDDAAALSTPGTFTLLSVHLKGLLGGHSGAQIHEPLGNGIQLLARILSNTIDAAPAGADVRLAAYKGGTAINAIPREARAVVAVRTAHVAEVVTLLDTAFASVVRGRYTLEQEPNAVLAVATMSGSDDWHRTVPTPLKVVEDELGESPAFAAGATNARLCALTPTSTRASLDYITSLHHGVIYKSREVEGLVETSIAFTVAQLTDSGLYCHLFARSSNDAHMVEVSQRLDESHGASWWEAHGLTQLAETAASRINGKTLQKFGPTPALNGFPGWMPNPHTDLLKSTRSAYESEYGVQPRVYAVHAGLECGFWQRTFAGMECVSVGPEVAAAHSPDERLEISTVRPFMRVLRATLDLLCRQ
ncbi:aminoacyl-histidine dipeptidase [Capsaspora owczarzaki ATCC 30864]|uniref:Aminoacyl-histidine dipeptidase n=1 Tax=Capsaspora owczarzaki (strain ATCC 30864) TaxID=595528 RepID=A0A0D2X035_CAPO3|nr:aminoacyl-histidine dipeptidase [Capsaspora owczarzaki ATCC 30864]KJE88369.1 aminoacyl-histidine dipeptidase [Capsaspora owczarzaki ATCC 30864]|eukprot:XP_004364901.1 aminoacyl-histidine dipeptidase [Capsaspora owczarzaki ATCC 30864]